MNESNATESTYTSSALPDGTYYWRVSSIDLAGNESLFSTADAFKVDTVESKSIIIKPSPFEILKGISSYNITGIAFDTGTGIKKIEVSTDGGSTWNDALGEESWVYQWDLTNEQTVTHTIKSRATDKADNVETPGTGVKVYVVPKPPSTITCNIAPTVISLGGTVNISGIINPGHQAFVEVVFTYTTNTNIAPIAQPAFSKSDGSYFTSYHPDIAGEWKVQASWAGASDDKGAVSDVKDFTVTKAATNLFMDLSSNSIIKGGAIDVQGVLSAGSGSGISLAGLPVSIKVTNQSDNVIT